MKKQIKILMVDDEKRFRETTKKILVKKGFDTILAESGEDALAKLGDNPDVVILDIKMPGMDGHETLKQIRKKRPELPVIMLTGHGDKPSARDALVEGAFDYLGKPCDINLLTEKIKEACSFKDKSVVRNESKVMDVMISIADYTTIEETKSLQDAIDALKKSFTSKIATNSLMETGHRSILVVDLQGEVTGILTIRDMLDMLMPGYLSAPRPSLADSIEYSPMFWSGMFTLGIRDMKNKTIRDAMSPSPISIDGRANLMEAAYRMVYANERRLLVTLAGKTAGIIREQDLFFEMEKILNRD
ncbi:Response regulator receiver protein [Desulfamplus magnetovallimortis]|uniref:Response regulator receiver protein n=1 Tax=Desulfamplus magnetovallimortis TaxID=1246637 RepID=A0A1W1H6L6_9BACT|nr:response regulator [Desulfamplus magnetovallimortis]SLM28018.1 Response regulator receiver protein [Desulfamplus magnetovallimortis]